MAAGCCRDILRRWLAPMTPVAAGQFQCHGGSPFSLCNSGGGMTGGGLMTGGGTRRSCRSRCRRISRPIKPPIQKAKNRVERELFRFIKMRRTKLIVSERVFRTVEFLLPQGGIASRNIETHDIANFDIHQQPGIHPVADGARADVVALCQVFFIGK